MALGCERVKSSAKSVIATSYSLQTQTKDRAELQDYVNLTNFLKDLSPEFTACGLFNIDILVIPAFVSTIATYAIIIIQFRNY